jgi:hypothetical protein
MAGEEGGILVPWQPCSKTSYNWVGFFVAVSLIARDPIRESLIARDSWAWESISVHESYFPFARSFESIKD